MKWEERLLVRRLNRGDATALSEVYERCRDDLLRLAGAMLHDGPAAEDIVQDVFVAFAAAARTFRLTGRLKGYLATCVANAARNRLKAAVRRRTTDLDAAADLASQNERPDRWMTLTEQFERVSDAMAELPAEQREAIALHVYGDLTFREIAQWQQTSIKTVQSRYRYGLDKLRSALNDEVAR
ncbi:MAG: RNA polymerase sigma factor [Sedimentisphaerales bacterium]|nr:RNA polymerase sigma factor [Sedimentisphaerales bacterium]HNY78580.1 RNA polymerase sigma factor [Sedimentisphaerales bacterium]HOC64244.1 RNA polymerase sigma factor [Sedimentisphaerales bacterium]HOH64562.1 RNA polymerase sigma factor [Sedimentisphaerales bacterium]HPY48397.1 RNA polymerase sigma factor [Sedimentisphaerales bacterium]